MDVGPEWTWTSAGSLRGAGVEGVYVERPFDAAIGHHALTGDAIDGPEQVETGIVEASPEGTANGKQRRVYRRDLTPWEVFVKLPNAGRYLKPGQSFRALKLKAGAESDTDSARRMQEARSVLFAELNPVGKAHEKTAVEMQGGG